jgi:hypothetical protein
MAAAFAAMPKSCRAMSPVPGSVELTLCHVKRRAVGTLVLDNCCRCILSRTDCSVDIADSTTAGASPCDSGAASTGSAARRLLLSVLLLLVSLLLHSDVSCTVVRSASSNSSRFQSLHVEKQSQSVASVVSQVVLSCPGASTQTAQSYTIGRHTQHCTATAGQHTRYCFCIAP